MKKEIAKESISKTTQPVIPASEARRESFLKTGKDSGQAGMTESDKDSGFTGDSIGKYFFIFFAFVLLYFWDVPVKGLSLIIGDGFTFYSVLTLISRQYRDLIFPFWNPYEFAGFPLMAGVHYGALYPPTIVLSILFNPSTAYSLNMILHLTLGGFFAYLYTKRLGLETLPSLIVGMLYSLLGYLPAHLQHPSIVYPGAWIPLILLLFEHLRNTPLFKYSVYAALAIASQFLSGSSQTCFYTHIILMIFVAFHSIYLKSPIRNKFIAYSALSFSLGMLILLPQIIASYELIKMGPQMSPSYEFFAQYSVPRDAIPAFFMPFLYGGFDGTVGTFAFFLAVAVFWREEKTNIHVKFWGLIAVVAFLLALGDTLRPLHKFMFHVPVYNFFRASGKHLVEVCFALSVLAGFGMSALLKENGAKTYRKALIIMASLTLVFAVVSFSLFKEQLSVIFPAFKGPGYSFYVPVALLFCYVLLLSFYEKLKKYAGHAIIVFIFIEALCFKVDYKFPSNYTEYYQKELFNYLKEDKENRSVFITLKIPYSLLAMPHGISTVDGYDTLMPHDYGKLLNMRAFGYSEEWPSIIENNLILSMLNAKYLVVDPSYGNLEDIRGLVKYASSGEKTFSAPIGNKVPFSADYAPIYKKVFEKDDIIAYENLNVLPRVYGIAKLKTIDSINDLRVNLYAFQIDPHREATVSSKDLEEIGKTDFSAGKVKILKYSSNIVTIEADFEGDGFLVLSDQFYPGWKAFIDGKQTNIYKTNGVLRGVIVPQGRHEVVFRYSPGKIYAAMAFSGVLLAGLLVLLIVKKKKTA